MSNKKHCCGEKKVIKGDVEFAGKAKFEKDVKIEGSLKVKGGAKIEGGLTTDNLSVSGNSFIAGNENVGKDLNVAGNSNIAGNENIAGDVIVGGNLIVKGQCTIIYSIPPGGYFITEPGCYRFGKELFFSEADGRAITISTPDVIIDGDEHSLTIGVDVKEGIYWSGVDNIVLRNMIVQASAQSFNDANHAIVAIDSNNCLFENVRTSLTYTGIYIAGCYDFRFIRIVQDNHSSGQTPVPGGHVESTALVILPSPTAPVGINSAQFIFYQCQWRDNMLIQGNDPTNFTGNDGILLTFNFDVPYATGDGISFIECQFTDTNIAVQGWRNILFDKCIMSQVTRQFLPQIECNYTGENISLRDCHLTNLNPIYCTDLIAGYSVNGMLIEKCMLYFAASGQNVDPTVAWPQWNSSAIRISAGITGGAPFGGASLGTQLASDVTVRGCMIRGGPPSGIFTPPPGLQGKSKSKNLIVNKKATSLPVVQKAIPPPKEQKAQLAPKVQPKENIDPGRKTLQKAVEMLRKTRASARMNRLELKSANKGIVGSSNQAGQGFHAIYVEEFAQNILIEDNTIAHYNSATQPVLPRNPNQENYSSYWPGGAIRVDGASGVTVRRNQVTDCFIGPNQIGTADGIVFGGNYAFAGLAVSTTLASYVQPAVGSNVSIPVTTSEDGYDIFYPGETIYVQGGGYYNVVSIDSPTSLTATNLGISDSISQGTPGNSPPGTVVPAGGFVAAAAIVTSSIGCLAQDNVVTNCQGIGIRDDAPAGNNRVVYNKSFNNITAYQIPDTATIVVPGAPSVAGENIK